MKDKDQKHHEEEEKKLNKRTYVKDVEYRDILEKNVQEYCVQDVKNKVMNGIDVQNIGNG